MQCVGFQRRTVGSLRHAIERPDAEKVDRNRDQQHGNHHRSRDNFMGLTQQAFAGLINNPPRRAQQQQHFKQRRQVFDFAMTKMVIIISRFVADTHRQPGNAGGDKIGERVDPFGNKTNTAGKNTGNKFTGCQ
ncbi:hypothetical protein D3C73_1210350 [compost metagenome]